MRVAGQRILIFGDSLSAAGNQTTRDVTRGTDRTSSAPGDLLASILLEQGAEAVRVNAKVGRSALSFWTTEPAAQLIIDDRNWKPSKVIVMLGTNDTQRDLVKTENAMASIRDAYKSSGAEVWAIGPMTYIGKGEPLNAPAALVLNVMDRVFGASHTIDARFVSGPVDRAGDGIHFSQSGARALAPQLAQLLLTQRAINPRLVKGLAVGFLGMLVLGLSVWAFRRRKLGAIGMLISPRVAGPALMALEASRSLDGELPPALMKRWKAAIGRYRKAIELLERGEDDISPAVRARDKLRKLRDEAAGHAPGSYRDPLVEALDAEESGLPKISDARETGRQARMRHYEEESKRLRHEEREARAPYEWMKK